MTVRMYYSVHVSYAYVIFSTCPNIICNLQGQKRGQLFIVRNYTTLATRSSVTSARLLEPKGITLVEIKGTLFVQSTAAWHCPGFDD